MSVLVKGEAFWTGGLVSFGFNDDKGRALGVVWNCFIVPAKLKAEGWTKDYPATLVVRVGAARDGRGFGASQPEIPVADLDAAFAEIARRASSSFKRYAKQFACESCGATSDVTFEPDPYASDLHNDQTPVRMCGACRRESAAAL